MYDPVIFSLSMAAGGFVGGAIAGVLFSHRRLVQQLRDLRASLHVANKALVTAGVEKRKLQQDIEARKAARAKSDANLRQNKAKQAALEAIEAGLA